MGARRPAGAAFTLNNGDTWLPDLTGVLFEHRTRVDNTTALKNWINPGVPATPIGTLTHGALYTDINGNVAVEKRIDTGISIPSGPAWLALAVQKGGVVGPLLSRYSPGSTYQTGFTVTTTDTRFWNSQISGQAAIPWPAAIGSKFLILIGWGDEFDTGHMQMGEGGAKLTNGEGGAAGLVADGTVAGAARGAANVVFGCQGSGTGVSKVGLGVAGAGRIPGYDERLELYQRVRQQLGAANVF